MTYKRSGQLSGRIGTMPPDRPVLLTAVQPPYKPELDWALLGNWFEIIICISGLITFVLNF